MAGASYLSLTDIGKSGGGGGGSSGGGKGGSRRQKPSVTGSGSAANGTNFGSTNLVRQPSHFDLSKTFGKSSYFSDMNPRSMKRLLNILGVTGWFIGGRTLNRFTYSCLSFTHVQLIGTGDVTL
jgi:hypothetical protein